MNTDPEILVAVGNPEHVEQLTRTAGDLARSRGGAVRLIRVVVKTRDSPFEVFSDATIRQEFAGDQRVLLERALEVAPDDVPVETELVVARSVADGVVRAAAETGADGLVIGWHGPTSRSAVVLGTSIDAILENAPCDVYVERIGRLAGPVERVLLPAGGGPHARPAATVAKAIAAANDATVSVVSVVTPETNRDAAAGWLAESVDALGTAPGPSVDIESDIRKSSDIEDTLVSAAADNDVIVFGATTRGKLRGRLVGSIPRHVGDRTDKTVIFARAGDAPSGRWRSLLQSVRPWGN